MGRIKEGLHGISGRMKGIAKNRQGRAFMRILQFFALMLALTLFARGAAAATMPQVETATLSQENIRRDETFSGTVASAGKTDVKMPVGLAVVRVEAVSGDRVEVGDVLATFDIAAVQDSLLAQNISLQELRLQLTELQKPMEQDDSAVKAANEALSAAQEGYSGVKAAGDGEVAAAQTALNSLNAAANQSLAELENKVAAAAAAMQTAQEAANDKRLVMPDLDTKLTEAREAWLSTNVEPDKTSAYSEYKAADQAVQDAQEVIAAAGTAAAAHTAAEGELSTAAAAKAEAQNGIGAAQSALDTAKTNAAKDLAAAQKTVDTAAAAAAEAQTAYNGESAAFSVESQKRRLEISKKQSEIAAAQKEADKLTELASLGGEVRATAAGLITQVTPSAGVTTAEGDYIRISTGEGGYLAEFSVSQAKAREIKAGSTVTVKIGQYYWGTEARVVGKSMPDEGGNITVRAALNSQDFSDGDAVSVTVLYSDNNYWNCVPVAAVRPEAGGYYVFVLSEESSIMGSQLVARKVAVTVQEQDASFAAIDGITEYEAKIVVSSSKPVNDGDTVRLSEEST